MVKKKIEKKLDELLGEALIKEEDKPYQIPENWVWVNLNTIAKWGSGGTPSRSKSEYYNGIIPWIKTGELNTDIIYDSKEKITILGLKKSNAKIFPRESIIIAMYGATIGKVSMLGIEASTNQACAVAIAHEYINTKFLFYYLKVQKDSFIELGKGGAQPNISQTVIKKYPFTFPPLPEQKRIVTKLSTMLEKLKQAKELIQEARETFETRRAAILHKAFTGELTKKWRKENEKFTANISSLTQIKEKPYDIASGWKWLLLKDVAEKSQYGTSAKSSKAGKIPVVRMGNIQNGRIDWNDLVYTSVEKEIEKYTLSHNDILFNRTNSPALVGKTAIYKNEMPAIFAGYLIRVRPKKNLTPDYLNYFLNSPYAKIKCQRVKTDGVNQSNINSTKLGNFEIPLTSIEEQKEIVRILDKILNKETESSHLIELENEIDLLEKSILSKAFRGELDTNNPDDGPAKELLKRILQEKKDLPKKKVQLKVSKPKGITTSANPASPYGIFKDLFSLDLILLLFFSHLSCF